MSNKESIRRGGQRSKRGEILEGLVDHWKDFNFYSEGNGGSLQDRAWSDVM